MERESLIYARIELACESVIRLEGLLVLDLGIKLGENNCKIVLYDIRRTVNFIKMCSSCFFVILVQISHFKTLFTKTECCCKNKF